MKKMVMMILLGLVSGSFAQDLVKFVGKVTTTRNGVNDAVFYTLVQNETGVKYQANTLAPDVKKHEELFKEALKNSGELVMEFDTNPQFPDAVRRIKTIELK